MSFPKINPKQSFPTLEEEILKFWEKEKIFEESVEFRPADKTFRFFDGPPFATGLPHYGHILQGVVKDLIPRYKTMRGYHVPRTWGWDCHGLPVENLIEKELGLKSKKDIESYGVAKFNEACRASVLRYAEEWKKTVKRMGRFIDMEHDYKTMDLPYMDSVWWVFKSLWDKNLIYEGLKPMHVCPRCVTPLSNFEVGQGYKDITDLSATVKFKLEGSENIYLLAWTTTPWTLPGNIALAVNPKIEYCEISFENQTYIVAKTLAEKIFEGREHVVGNSYPGSKLIGKTYQPLFPYFADKKSEGGFKVVAGDFVTTEEGTGIVHIAPAFGEDDYNSAKENKLPIIQHVGMDGKFTAAVKDFAELDVKPADDPMKADRKVVDWLEKNEKLFSKQNYKHAYPHCWRCDTPLLNYATSSWFVKVEAIKNQLVKENQKINWVPAHIRDGRFGKWLEGARDWAISRNRFWGAPLPVWKCDKCKEVVCVSGQAELEKLSGKKVPDLHKHFVDEISWKCTKCSGSMRRVSEVLDCWFESGSMPYQGSGVRGQEPGATTPRPTTPLPIKEMCGPAPLSGGSNKKAPLIRGASRAKPRDGGLNPEPCNLDPVPCDFIAEAQDQTRGWFYTLHVLSTALFGKPAYSNCVCSGLVLAEDGQKMSKSKRNFPDPQKIFDTYGADAMRLYLMSSPVVHAEDLRFSEKGVEETLRSVLLPLWNTFYFFTTYANADKWKPGVRVQGSGVSNKLDAWILSELNLLIREMDEKLEAYEIQAAVKPLANFLDGLTNWYIRRSRRRFWKSENDGDKNEAYATLFHVLVTVSKLLAPVCPFIAEKIYKDLTGEKSVHLSDWPERDENRINRALSAEIATTRQIISLGLALRSREKIKVRQPLSAAVIALPQNQELELDTIQEELNVKTIEFAANPEEIAERIVEVNARALGPRVGGKVQEIIRLAKAGQFEITAEGVKVGDEILTGEEIKIGYRGKTGQAVESNAGIVVALDIKITPELELEGQARDLVRLIQDLRKQADYQVSDRIELQIEGAQTILKAHQNYIATETLAEKVVEKLDTPDVEATLGEIKVGVKKVENS